MFGLFKKKKDEIPAPVDFNYEQVAVDLHSHVLPGIDDGAQTLDDSVALVRRMVDLGIKKIIATPHIMAGFYNNTPETIITALDLLRERLVEEKLDVNLSAAAEHYFDETFEQRIYDRHFMTMGENFVLFELSFISRPPNLIEIIRKMRSHDYQPILAHPERYPFLTIDDFVEIREWGCLLQLNTISLSGYYGKGSQQMAEKLIDNKMIDFISSDMHHLRHAEALENTLRESYLKKLLFEQQPLKNKLLL